ncbi:hypothetical protein [Burkholderia pseudomultivorans]|nr:hypothetical protein [Burkholderia pseudomultivorans]
MTGAIAMRGVRPFRLPVGGCLAGVLGCRQIARMRGGGLPVQPLARAIAF